MIKYTEQNFPTLNLLDLVITNKKRTNELLVRFKIDLKIVAIINKTPYVIKDQNMLSLNFQ